MSIHRGGSIVTYNRRFLELWKIPEEFARRADNERLISFVLDQLADPSTFLRITRENQTNPEREFFSLLRFKDGRVVERFSRARRVGEEIVGRIVTFRDVTERERLLEQAYDAVRTREELLSVVPHGVPAPMAAMSLAAQSLLEAAPPKEATVRCPEPHQGDQPRLHLLIEALVDVARIRAGTLPPALEPVDLVAVVRDGVRRHAHDLARSGSTVTLSGSSAVFGQWTRSALDQIFSNLLSNAIEFGQGGPIDVDLGERAGRAWLTVRDRGIGLSPSIQARISGPLEQGFWERSDGRLALGLYVVRTIVKALGGTLHVDRQPNVGASFGVELPQGLGVKPG